MKNERLMRYGATFTAVAALGGLSLKSVEASAAGVNTPDTITHINKGPVLPNYPAGIHTIGNELAKQKEMGEALRHMNQRWNNIVLVLHAPKKNVIVGFGTSPSAYDNENPNFTMLGPQAGNVVVIPQPGRVMFKPHGSKTKREFAVIYDIDRKPLPSWEFLDIAYAQQSGALDIYKIKGDEVGLGPYPLAAQEADMPAVDLPQNYAPTWFDAANASKGLYSVELPNDLDSHKKTYKLEQISSLPSH